MPSPTITVSEASGCLGHVGSSTRAPAASQSSSRRGTDIPPRTSTLRPVHAIATASSGRAGEVLGAYRARLEEEPILVVPAFRDVEHTLRELAGGGAVFGTTVVRFKWLFDTIAERCGAPPARRASDVQRELLVEEA